MLKHKLTLSSLLLAGILTLAQTALAATTWYVNGANGSDSNNCMSPLTACRTIGHAISLAHSGDSIMVAAATYYEHLTIGLNLTILGSSAQTTIIDGGGVNRVVTISNSAAGVTLSHLTIRHGFAQNGGGIYNNGTLTINNCVVSGNSASDVGFGGHGGGIYSAGNLTINHSTISGNSASSGEHEAGNGGGINNAGSLTINNSTVSGNSVLRRYNVAAYGGGIGANGSLKTINNSTVSGNGANIGGGIAANGGLTTINNSTISENSLGQGSGISFTAVATVTLQNSIVANNIGGNCYGYGTMTSHGYNLSGDNSCNFHGSGDRNNINPLLGALQNNGGPTQTMALLPGSPAIDAGNPSGCTDGHGHLLTTDQRGMPRPDKEDTGGCDMGAYERQTD
jgi:hypothetical protein